VDARADVVATAVTQRVAVHRAELLGITPGRRRSPSVASRWSEGGNELRSMLRAAIQLRQPQSVQ